MQNTLQNVGNFNLLNGVGSVQLIPGGGDATHGNTGTGLVLFTAKHGTFPTYVHADVEALMFPYLHQLGFEWGWADPKQHLSNYAGFIGVRKNYQYGIPGTAANTLGTLGTNAATLGQRHRPELGLLRAVVSVVERFRRQLDLPVWQEPGPAAAVLHSRPADHAKTRLRRFSVFAVHFGRQRRPDKCARYPVIGPNGSGQHAAAELCVQRADSALSRPAQHLRVRIAARHSCKSPFLAYKFEYGANIGATSLLTARYFRTFIQQSQHMPAQGIFASPYGGFRTAGQIDYDHASRQQEHV